jgi:heme exporter protein D
MVEAACGGYLMYFESLAAVWHMDGHGFYVWLAYALTALPLVLMVWLPLKRIRQHVRWLQAEQRRSAAATQSTAMGSDV